MTSASSSSSLNYALNDYTSQNKQEPIIENVNRISAVSFNQQQNNDFGFEHNHHNYNVPNIHQFQGIGGYSVSMLSSAQQISALRDKCLRCSNQVYALERIGPIKGNIYHKTCFKCLICERQLDLKTYYTNQIDLNDRQIYCQSHAPKCGKGIFGADSIYIHNVLNAPKLDVMQKVDNKPKVIPCCCHLSRADRVSG